MMSVAASGSEAGSVRIDRDANALVIAIGEEITNVLGWPPEALLGRPSTEFIHPDDQPSAVAAWLEMVDSPGEARTWQGRYRTADGAWKWVECVNVNMLGDHENPMVQTTMRAVAGEQVSLAEELRVRKQLFSQLSDAMPVGMFQIDRDKTITFANDRLYTILGYSPTATVDGQFSIIVEDDRSLLESAIDAVFDDEAVDDIELRFSRYVGDTTDNERVCALSMRPLTDWSGDVTGAVGCVSDVTAQVDLRRQLENRANTDELTSCLSRAKILDVLTAVLDPREEIHGGTAVIFIDLCGFKNINDLFGHAAGDRVLKVAGARLKATVRQYDQVGRFGGDEFLVVCPRVKEATTALEVARRINLALTEPVSIAGDVVELRASVGVSWSSEVINADALVAQADQAMYESKRSGSHAAALYSLEGSST
jgi:diguanylate cyclase (GGDEF)-like protein/PAS domain S-box-containing protein